MMDLATENCDSDYNDDALNPTSFLRRTFTNPNVAFIKKVRKLPVLWDQNHPEYNNKFVKQEAWATINKLYDQDWDDRSDMEKDEAVANLAKKWKSLRDGYSRENKLRRRRNSIETKLGRQRKPYQFYNLLTFLEKGIKSAKEKGHDNSETPEPQDNMSSLSTKENLGHVQEPENYEQEREQEEVPTSVDYECIVDEIPAGIVKAEKHWETQSVESFKTVEGNHTKRLRSEQSSYKRVDHREDTVPNEISVPNGDEIEGKCIPRPRGRPLRLRISKKYKDNAEKIEESDRRMVDQWDSVDQDKLFLLSLVSDVKQVPDHLRLDMRVEIINVVKKYKNMKRRPQ